MERSVQEQMCQGPEAGPSLARWKDRKKTKVAEFGGAKEIEVADGVREKPDPRPCRPRERIWVVFLGVIVFQ